MTPAEFLDLIDGYLWREEKRAEEIVYQAWLIAGLGRVKRMPKLSRLLKKAQKKTEIKDIEKSRRDWDYLKARFGG